jgi:hypothetical protein
LCEPKNKANIVQFTRIKLGCETNISEYILQEQVTYFATPHVKEFTKAK